MLEARGDSPQARVALSELCAAYWKPVFHFLRHEGHPDETAKELSQEFFARVLEGRSLTCVDPARGRFRSFLLGALKHFLADARDRENCLKRGGGVRVESLDVEPVSDTGTGFEIADPRTPVPDSAFDRAWALETMDRVFQTLRAEFETDGRLALFECLKPWLVGENSTLSQSAAAHLLGLSEGAVKVAIHRLRKRFRELIRFEVAQTVPADSEISAEIRYLVAALSSSPR